MGAALRGAAFFAAFFATFRGADFLRVEAAFFDPRALLRAVFFAAVRPFFADLPAFFFFATPSSCSPAPPEAGSYNRGLVQARRSGASRRRPGRARRDHAAAGRPARFDSAPCTRESLAHPDGRLRRSDRRGRPPRVLPAGTGVGGRAAPDGFRRPAASDPDRAVAHPPGRRAGRPAGARGPRFRRGVHRGRRAGRHGAPDRLREDANRSDRARGPGLLARNLLAALALVDLGGPAARGPLRGTPASHGRRGRTEGETPDR